MCGIVGVAGFIGPKEDKALKTLLILDALRGIDSTGIAAIPRDGDVRVVKQLGNPYELFEHRSYLPAMNRMNRAIIGHNRFATQGGVNRKNAHPFEFDTLVGVHNGTLRNKYKLLDAAHFQVDSENLYHHIEQEGLNSFLKVVDGAYALVWWDKQTEELNFLRNKERPMWCVKSEFGQTMFWASERWMIEVACDREGIKLGEFHWMMEDMLYQIGINDKGVMDKPVVTEAKSKFIPEKFNTTVWKDGKWVNKEGTEAKKANLVVVSNGAPARTSNTTEIDVKKNLIASSTASRKGYVSSKGLALELMALCVDNRGSRYISCLDALEPLVKIRLYYNRDDEIQNQIGEVILADIKDIQVHRTEGTFYKVARSSVKDVPKIVMDAETLAKVCAHMDDRDDLIEDEPDEVLVPDHRGQMISEEQFVVTYGTCASCTGFVDPGKKHRFCANGGEAICDVCLSDPETVKYLPSMI